MKEHCKTCLHADIFNVSINGVEAWCEWRGEDIEDLENETCFDWEEDFLADED